MTFRFIAGLQLLLYLVIGHNLCGAGLVAIVYQSFERKR
jgi:hypothetical protein